MPFIHAKTVIAKLWPHGDIARFSHTRLWPERVVLPPAPDRPPSPKAPVRIFVGTEPSQLRAERVFVWSIEQVRDPSRTYEIYLMKQLTGFDRSRWTTGFTNYRFAIPHFAQGVGRAIYNDVDQIYLADPAELFDTDMGEHGFLAISDTESSVMLLDCARMRSIWTLEDAQTRPKKKLLARATGIPRLRGVLSPNWNARDEEFVSGRSKLLHFTTLHTQPWAPFPKQFVYQEHPFGAVWRSLEQSADAVGFHLFTRTQPSRAYRERCAALRSVAVSPGESSAAPPAAITQHGDALARLIQLSGARRLLLYGPGTAARNGNGCESLPDWSLPDGVRVTRYDPLDATSPRPTEGSCDGVVCLDWLDRLPEEDVPWALDDLLQLARLFVYAAVTSPADQHHHVGENLTRGTSRPTSWWQDQFERSGKRHPGLRWEVGVGHGSGSLSPHMTWIQGGKQLGQAKPTVWVLAEERPGNNTLSIGLAQSLGWPCAVKALRFNVLARLPNRLLGASALGLRRASRAELAPPWPDLVIVTGRRLAPIARWLRMQSRGRTRVVHLGRKGGLASDSFDLTVTCAHFGLPADPRRLETVVPPNPIGPDRLAEASAKWPSLFGDAPRPHVALLVGGTSPVCRLDSNTARRLGQAVRAFVEDAGGTVHALTSRRTGRGATKALEGALGAPHRLLRWQPGQQENPYLGYLATADAVIVTGESESMLAETAASGKPMYIYQLPPRRLGIMERFRAWLVNKSQARPANNRGTVRPQQGLEYLCARILASGIILPPRNIRALHQRLFDLGVARPFGAPLDTGPRPCFNETEKVAHRVHAMMGVSDVQDDTTVTRASESVATKV